MNFVCLFSFHLFIISTDIFFEHLLCAEHYTRFWRWSGEQLKKGLALTELTLTVNSTTQLIVTVIMATNEKYRVVEAP